MKNHSLLKCTFFCVSLFFAVSAHAMDNTYDLKMTGSVAGDEFGDSVSATGDVNGDGFDDMIVGASVASNGSVYSGRVYIYLGGATPNNVADIVLDGENDMDGFGWSVAAGDVNNDGFDDVVVGAPWGGNYTNGRAYLFHGGASMNSVVDVVFDSTDTDPAAQEKYGWALDARGDVNNDGYDDIIIGAPNRLDITDTYQYGEAYVFLGGSTVDNTPDVTFAAMESQYNLGYSVSNGGDLNGDGYDDIVIGAPKIYSDTTDHQGRVDVYFGGASINNYPDLARSGYNAMDSIGMAVSIAGDLNGDGFDDVVSGARNGNFFLGRVNVFLGGSSMDMVSDLAVPGAASGDNLGWSVSGVGDVNKDGYDDMIVGAIYADGGSGSGRAYLFYGGSALDGTADMTFSGENADDEFGTAISSGDINNDGEVDFLVSAAYYQSYDATGAAYVFLGTPAIVAPSATTSAVSDITQTTATGNGSVTATGGENPTRYVQWGTTAGVYTDNCNAGIGGTGDYSCAMTGLTPSTTYYVQAYATNSAGTGYGSETSFTTAAVSIVAPTITTSAVTDISETTATGNGSVTATGGENPTRYVQWGTTTGVYTDNCNAGSGSTGSYSCAMTSLSPNTTYYVRAYATNSGGTGYGSETSFTTSSSGSGDDDDDPPVKPHIKDISDVTDDSLTIKVEVDPSYAGQELDFEIKIRNKDDDETDTEKVTKRADENGKISIGIDDLKDHTDYSISVRFSPGGQENYSDFSETESVQTERDITDDEKCMTNNLEAEKALGSIKLSWDETCEDINGILIERKIGDGEFEQIDSVDEDETSFVDKDVDEYGEYIYRARGYKGDKYTEYSDEVSVVYSPISRDWDDSSFQETSQGQEGQPSNDAIGITQDISQNQPQEVAVGNNEDIIEDESSKNEPEENNAENNSTGKRDSDESALAFVFDRVKEFTQEFSMELASLAVAGLAAGVAVAGSSSTIPLLSTSAEPFRGGMYRLFGIIGIITNKKKRNEDWGVVFDSETKRPIGGVVISLINESGHVVDTVVSDSQGRYGFLPNPGKYTMRISRQNYTFDRSEKESSLYGDLYAGEEINVSENQIEKMSIAMCSTTVDWKDFARRKIAAYMSVFSVIKRDFSIILFYAGFIISGGIVFMFRTPLNIVIFGVYVCLLAYQLFFKKKAYGIITHAQTGKPVPFAMVAIYDENEPQRRVAFAVSDVLGRYYLLAKNGNYLAKISGNLLGGERFEKTIRANVTDGIVRVDVEV